MLSLAGPARARVPRRRFRREGGPRYRHRSGAPGSRGCKSGLSSGSGDPGDPGRSGGRPRGRAGEWRSCVGACVGSRPGRAPGLRGNSWRIRPTLRVVSRLPRWFRNRAGSPGLDGRRRALQLGRSTPSPSARLDRAARDGPCLGRGPAPTPSSRSSEFEPDQLADAEPAPVECLEHRPIADPRRLGWSGSRRAGR